LAALAIAGIRQTVYCKAQVRKHVVINDIVKEDCVRIERFLVQNDAIIKGFVVTDGSVSACGYELNFRTIDRKSL
jgi:hypothetical protein